VLLGSLQDHARSWFAAAAAIVWMVGAVVDAIDHHALFLQPRKHVVCKSGKIFTTVQPASDTRLVGDDDELESSLAQLSQTLENPLDKDESLLGADIAIVDIDHPVSVEENRPMQKLSFIFDKEKLTYNFVNFITKGDDDEKIRDTRTCDCGSYDTHGG